MIKSDTIAGKEYTLYARAYGMDGKLMVSAELKLVTLEDEYYPYEEVIKNRWGYSEMTSVGDVLTRFVSVELVSYEYSDMYKLLY